MKIVELRHLDEIKGNFGIMDGREFRSSPKLKAGQPPEVLIRSTMKDFVEQQQYFFETLWKRAIPAKQRIREIEEGAKREFVEVIRDPYEIQKIGFDLVNKAEEEILVVFSTPNAFRRQERVGALHLLEQAATRGVNTRILVPKELDREINEIVQSLKTRYDSLDIRSIKKPLQTKLTTLIVDQSLVLTVELSDDSNESSEEAIGLATFSNSESSVLTYTSIFENMWMETELLQHRRATTTI